MVNSKLFLQRLRTVVDNVSSSSSSLSSLTWLVVFVPALVYLISTRLNQTTALWGGVLGEPFPQVKLVVLPIGEHTTEAEDPVATMAACEELAKVFYLSSSSSTSSACSTVSAVTDPMMSELELKHGYGVMVVLKDGDGLHDIVDSLWRHDSELGRGYLLLSSSYGNGRVWRWEVGGGPIAIGKTLHLEDAGCRSNLHRTCQITTSNNKKHHNKTNNSTFQMQVGSGGLTIDFTGKDHFSEGRLVVAEWGEGRVVRLEENGARTPLVIRLPHHYHHDDEKNEPLQQDEDAHDETATITTTRVQRPTKLLFTPFGDLLLVEDHDVCNLHSNFHCARKTQTQTSTDNNNNNNITTTGTIEPPQENECDSIDTTTCSSSTNSNIPNVAARRASLFRLPLATHVEPLASLTESRMAHAWTSVEQWNTHDDKNNDSTTLHGKVHHPQQKQPLHVLPDLVQLGDNNVDDFEYDDDDVQDIGGIAITHEWTSIYVVARRKKMSGQGVVLLKVFLYEDDDDEDEDAEKEEGRGANTKSSTRGRLLLRHKPEVVVDLTPYYDDASSSSKQQQQQQQKQRPGSIAVSQNHVFVVVSNGVLVIDPVKKIILGKLHMMLSNGQVGSEGGGDDDHNVASQLTSLTLGEDGYLYMTTRTSLLRIRLRPQIMPVKVPTNLLPKSKQRS